MNFANLKYFLTLSLLLLICNTISAQAWTYVKEEDGIKIFTRKDPGTSLKSFMGITDVKSTMAKVTNLIGNVKNHDWWDENVTEIKVLAFEKDKYFQYYVVYKVPWPFNDRDLCVEAHVTIDPVSGRRVIMATPLDSVVPEKPERVRIKKYWQRWTVQPMENGKIHLVLEGFVDPEAGIPSWLYNMVIVETPLKVMRRVKRFVE
jgi:hypothetical protein